MSKFDPYGGAGGGNAPRPGAIKPPAPGVSGFGGIVETGREFLGDIFTQSAGAAIKNAIGGQRAPATGNSSFDREIEPGQSLRERQAQEGLILGLDLSDRNTQIGIALAGAAVGLILWRLR